MQAHDFHQHLVGIGCAIEGASAGAVIGLGFGFQQFRTAHFALCIEHSHFGLFVVGQARSHGASGDEYGRQMAERQSANDQARHNLVTYAQINRRIKHLV